MAPTVSRRRAQVPLKYLPDSGSESTDDDSHILPIPFENIRPRSNSNRPGASPKNCLLGDDLEIQSGSFNMRFVYDDLETEFRALYWSSCLPRIRIACLVSFLWTTVRFVLGIVELSISEEDYMWCCGKIAVLIPTVPRDEKWKHVVLIFVEMLFGLFCLLCLADQNCSFLMFLLRKAYGHSAIQQGEEKYKATMERNFMWFVVIMQVQMACAPMYPWGKVSLWSISQVEWLLACFGVLMQFRFVHTAAWILSCFVITGMIALLGGSDCVLTMEKLPTALGIGVVSMIVSWRREQSYRLQFLSVSRSKFYRKHFESILKHMLPSAAAEFLLGRTCESVTSKNNLESSEFGNYHESTSVLFVRVNIEDSGLKAEEMVKDLNSFFRTMDSEVHRHKNAFKVETIGAEYMVASGVPEKCSRHAQVLSRLALSLQRCVRGMSWSSGKEVRLRMGIHSGCCFAGIAGKDTPRFRLFGDTVNTAARMKSIAAGEKSKASGEVPLPDRNAYCSIILSDSTAELLKLSSCAKELLADEVYSLSFKREKSVMKRLGKVEVKGKGEMTVWQLFRTSAFSHIVDLDSFSQSFHSSRGFMQSNVILESSEEYLHSDTSNHRRRNSMDKREKKEEFLQQLSTEILPRSSSHDTEGSDDWEETCSSSDEGSSHDLVAKIQKASWNSPFMPREVKRDKHMYQAVEELPVETLFQQAQKPLQTLSMRFVDQELEGIYVLLRNQSIRGQQLTGSIVTFIFTSAIIAFDWSLVRSHKAGVVTHIAFFSFLAQIVACYGLLWINHQEEVYSRWQTFFSSLSCLSFGAVFIVAVHFVPDMSLIRESHSWFLMMWDPRIFLLTCLNVQGLWMLPAFPVGTLLILGFTADFFSSISLHSAGDFESCGSGPVDLLKVPYAYVVLPALFAIYNLWQTELNERLQLGWLIQAKALQKRVEMTAQTLIPAHVLKAQTVAMMEAAGGWGVEMDELQVLPSFFFSESLPSVCQLMADVEGFTALSSGLEAKKLFKAVNELFTEFDELCRLWRITKIETIGDAYWCAVGLDHPADREDALRLMQVALIMQKRLRSRGLRTLSGQKLKMRVGLHWGPVVGGVVGWKMPRYHLFGRNVDLVMAMEQLGTSEGVVASSSFMQLTGVPCGHEFSAEYFRQMWDRSGFVRDFGVIDEMNEKERRKDGERSKGGLGEEEEKEWGAAQHQSMGMESHVSTTVECSEQILRDCGEAMNFTVREYEMKEKHKIEVLEHLFQNFDEEVEEFSLQTVLPLYLVTPSQS